MTDKDVDTVCSDLRNVPFPELLRLYSLTVPRTAPVVFTPVELITALRNWLHSSYILQERLSCIAELYCRLATIGSIKPWTLYRLRAPMKECDAVPFLNILSNKMEHGTLSCAKRNYRTRESVCCSVLLSDGPLAIVEHRLVCFIVWPMHPFLAVHAPGTIAHSEKLYAALVSALGNPERCLHGYYEDIPRAIGAILSI